MQFIIIHKGVGLTSKRSDTTADGQSLQERILTLRKAWTTLLSRGMESEVEGSYTERTPQTKFNSRAPKITLLTEVGNGKEEITAIREVTSSGKHVKRDAAGRNLEEME